MWYILTRAIPLVRHPAAWFSIVLEPCYCYNYHSLRSIASSKAKKHSTPFAECPQSFYSDEVNYDRADLGVSGRKPRTSNEQSSGNLPTA
jgi:hypothetical protein